jgi:hypothetical protein
MKTVTYRRPANVNDTTAASAQVPAIAAQPQQQQYPQEPNGQAAQDVVTNGNYAPQQPYQQPAQPQYAPPPAAPGPYGDPNAQWNPMAQPPQAPAPQYAPAPVPQPPFQAPVQPYVPQQPEPQQYTQAPGTQPYPPAAPQMGVPADLSEGQQELLRRLTGG